MKNWGHVKMSNKRILHVEDDEATLLLLQGAIGTLGELVQTSSIERALQLLEGESFKLVILDFTLPDGSGQALLRHLRSLIEPPVVIVLSGHELVKDMPGVDKVLTKGRYQMKDLVQYVKKVLADN